MRVQDLVLLFALSALPSVVVAQSDESEATESETVAGSSSGSSGGASESPTGDGPTGSSSSSSSSSGGGASESPTSEGPTSGSASSSSSSSGGATESGTVASPSSSSSSSSGSSNATTTTAATTTAATTTAAASGGSDGASLAPGATPTCATHVCTAPKISVPSKAYTGDGSACCEDAAAAATTQLTAALTALTAAFNSIPAVADKAVAGAPAGLTGKITMAAPTGGKATLTGLTIAAATVAEANTLLNTLGMKCPIIATISANLECVLMKLTMAASRRVEEDARRLAVSNEITMEPHASLSDAMAGVGQQCALKTGSKTCSGTNKFNNFGYCNATACDADDLALGFCCQPGTAQCISMPSSACGTGKEADTSKAFTNCAGNPCASADVATCCKATTGATPPGSNAMTMTAAAAFALAVLQ